MIWTAGFRTAVISPYEKIQLTEPRGFADQTVRQVLHMAGGGERLRVHLTNRYGRTPLTIGAAVAATEPGRAALTFGGSARLTIPPGEQAVSDPIELPVRRRHRPAPQPPSARRDRPGHLFPHAHGDRPHRRR